MARYQVFLDSPLGERRGMLMLHEDGIVHAGSILMKLRGTAIEEGVQQVTKKEHRNHGTSDHT